MLDFSYLRADTKYGWATTGLLCRRPTWGRVAIFNEKVIAGVKNTINICFRGFYLLRKVRSPPWLPDLRRGCMIAKDCLTRII